MFCSVTSTAVRENYVGSVYPKKNIFVFRPKCPFLFLEKRELVNTFI